MTVIKVSEIEEKWFYLLYTLWTLSVHFNFQYKDIYGCQIFHFLNNMNHFLKKESKSRHKKKFQHVIYFQTYVLNKALKDDCFVRGKSLHPQGFFLPWSWPCLCFLHDSQVVLCVVKGASFCPFGAWEIIPKGHGHVYLYACK